MGKFFEVKRKRTAARMKKGLEPFQAPALVPWAQAAIQKTATCCAESSSQLGLDLLHDAGKSGLVVHGDIGEDLAVDLDTGLADAVGELAVGQAQFTGGGVDTRNPQLAEHALLGTAVTVGVLACLHHRLLGDAENIAAT